MTSILLVTSRDVDERYNGIEISKVLTNRLTEEVYAGNQETMENLRVGIATNKEGRENWTCTIFPDVPLGQASPDSAKAFANVAKRANQRSRPILLYVHGYNNTVASPLEAALDMQNKYDCEVVCFLWPSEGRFQDYGEDRKDAELTARPFLRFLHKSKHYLERARNQQRVVLLCHSMGCYVLQNAIKHEQSTHDRTSGVEGGRNVLTKYQFFDDIIITAADVDSHQHLDWVSVLEPKDRVFIFINKGDDVLRLSDWIGGQVGLATSVTALSGPDHPPRLGQTLDNVRTNNKRVYINLDVTKKSRSDFLQFLQMEHWYHRYGQETIATTYQDVIQGDWSPLRYRQYLDRTARYYTVRGYSDQGRSLRSRL